MAKKENIKMFLSLIEEYQDPINKEIKDDKEAEEIWALMSDLESKLEAVKWLKKTTLFLLICLKNI